MRLVSFLLLPLLTVHSTWGDTQPAACCPPSVYEVKATMFQAIQEDSRFKYQEVRASHWIDSNAKLQASELRQKLSNGTYSFLTRAVAVYNKSRSYTRVADTCIALDLNGAGMVDPYCTNNATYIRSLVLGYGRNTLQVNIRQNTVMLMGKDSQLTDISTADCVPVLQGFASYIDSGFQYSIGVYDNFQPHISDRAVFNVPEECRNATVQRVDA
ncbi:hypothetical protein C0Q70_06128 [Pomacea canaliculata]|uniref:Uncharacterized protein n=1 Tax=Pomacea canaliculata TaxID=400727 RepID=A0A2T7PN51_POMCA|nr:uncharacterized protein LOC112559853 [Pomacea canaliculata]PVD34849.1 hypothetical protein C0Q70_06128 [Pomacea canaliculata]